MSMSENKKDERVSKAAEEYAHRQKKNKTVRTVVIIAAVVLVIGLVALSFFTSGTWYRTRTALTVDGHKVSCAEFNYYYFTGYNELYQSLQETYGESASAILDTKLPLDEQQYSETETWDQHIRAYAIQNIEQVYALFYTSLDDGYSLPADKVAELAASADYVTIAASQYGYTENQYLTALYGKGMNIELYDNCALMMATAAEYYTEKTNGFTYTADEVSAYYNDNIQSFDTMNLRIYTINKTDTLGNEVDAEGIANDMLSQLTDEQSFKDLAYDLASDTDKANFTEDSATYYTGIGASSLACEGMADWFYDEARKPGDKNIFSDDTAYYVVMWVSREDNNYNEVSMRHILAKFATEEDGTVADSAKDAAKTLAENYMEEWKGSDMTEDYFAQMANSYSDDGDGTTGGLYENIYKGSMMTEINDWLFTDGRKTGDCEIIETTYGYHLVYFVNADGPIYRDTLVESAMKTAAMDEWYADASASYTAVLDDAVMSSSMVA